MSLTIDHKKTPTRRISRVRLPDDAIVIKPAKLRRVPASAREEIVVEDRNDPRRERDG